MTDRYLIVNADDFGSSAGVDRGIVEAHERGIVTSASLMVRGASAAEAAAYARARPELSVGLHVDLGEWVYRNGEWAMLYEVAPAEDERAVREEFDRQLARFQDLVGREPTHLDSHQHVHRHDPLRSLMVDAAGRLSVPLRHFDPRIRYEGSFYGQTGKGAPYPEGIAVVSLVEVLRGLPAGITELLCHPGLEIDHPSSYAGERRQEVEALCDPRVRETIDAEGIRLLSFGELPKVRSGEDLRMSGGP